MKEGYPEDQELELIEKWSVKDVRGLLDFIKERWWMPDWGFMQETVASTGNNSDKPHLKVALHTGGWSGNESIMEALQNNRVFWMLFHTKWERGGHFYFEIPTANL